MADTIKILVATDNHVGAHERDPIRGDDSWKSFHEIMCLAKERDVDMVLLAGDLFHENKPSRKSMYNVMRSIRLNCLSDKPCELEMLSDESEHFDATFDHVNYEDPNINVGIPVFSIHGNHDDPTGEGHYAALDLLAVSGLVNYFGKTPESDNIVVKPVLIQKGRTKLALYGISNVRDERLFRTFRDGKVQFHRPSTQMGDWYNVVCVHQNHHAHTETSYLPESFLPDFLDFVIWGHEHECEIEPRWNPEMDFQVMQPGSSVATSLMPGEAVPKHVALVTITGREMKSEAIRLKTVRPFVYKDISLSTDKEAVRIAKRKEEHRALLTQHLIEMVENLIKQARQEWEEAQEGRQDDADEPEECPLPLVRLRVETSTPEGVGKFDIENPQRFSQRFTGRVANTNDVVQFHIKKKNAAARAARDKEADREIMAKFQGVEVIQIEKLVHEFLQAQSLTILPQNYFGDAVGQYVNKDDKHAMELFVNESLADQIKNLVKLQSDANDNEDDEDLATQINEQRARMEEMFAKGLIKVSANKARFKPKPDGWDSDLDGPWEEQPGAIERASEDLEDRNEVEDEEDGTPAPRTATRGRGRGRGGRGATAASTRKTAATKKATTTTTKTTTRGKKRAVPDDDDEDEEEEDDVVMLDDDDEEDDSQAMFFPDTRKNGTASTSTRGRATAPASSTRAKKAVSPAKKPPARAAASRGKQSTLSFTTSQASILGNGTGRSARPQSADYDIEDEDDDDAFEPIPATRRRR
ncbi:meiotic recombination [Elasticomyces elasticus]|uniref:Double-strand break repair protein n=1 Tax=Exophiala sideris TaxID=1016849 RepID=A0ABR0J003_9EURO|nr:meiotic recombination [Elasticomyces elasticus]KAK5023266.1 meiotic recombination [Exophiala sideris]KAK5028638.1 meiotic recombination [Exophiala sideris]KAK5053016.1 meiotic recombination [Exophiala sideris]KAK5178756.1 meiotic recombination [Eurotiomycetes sp. CCFEE 6388]